MLDCSVNKALLNDGSRQWACARSNTSGPLSCTSHHGNFMSYSNIEFGPLHTWIKTCSRSWIPMNPHESPNRQVRLVHLPINCRSERNFLDSEMTRSQHQQHLFERSVSLVSTIWYDLDQNSCCKPGYRCVVYSIIHHNSNNTYTYMYTCTCHMYVRKVTGKRSRHNNGE